MCRKKYIFPCSLYPYLLYKFHKFCKSQNQNKKIKRGCDSVHMPIIGLNNKQSIYLRFWVVVCGLLPLIKASLLCFALPCVVLFRVRQSVASFCFYNTHHIHFFLNYISYCWWCCSSKHLKYENIYNAMQTTNGGQTNNTRLARTPNATKWTNS